MNNYIEQLKNDTTVNRFKDDNDNSYGIRVIGRGSYLFFQENDKALICQIDASNSVIFSKTIKKWNGKKKMTKQEKERITSLIKKYYECVYDSNVTISNENIR